MSCVGWKGRSFEFEVLGAARFLNEAGASAAFAAWILINAGTVLMVRASLGATSRLIRRASANQQRSPQML